MSALVILRHWAGMVLRLIKRRVECMIEGIERGSSVCIAMMAWFMVIVPIFRTSFKPLSIKNNNRCLD